MKLIIVLIPIAALTILWLLLKQKLSFSSNHKVKISNYSIASQDLFNQPDFYDQDIWQDHENYQPVASWIGKLILPDTSIKNFNQDIVKFEIYHAPIEFEDFIGKIVSLSWINHPDVKEFIRSVTRDIQFNQETKISQTQGYVLPDRLNGRHHVGPLESLAGSRPQDDLIVQLALPVVIENSVQLLDRIPRETREIEKTLNISQPPIQVTGRWRGLVRIIQRVSSTEDRFEVCHYDPTSQKFEGQIEILHIPQVRADQNGIFRSKSEGIEISPLNSEGWYIYGAKDGDGTFVVQAIEPRKITQLVPTEIHLGIPAGLNYINQLNWQNIETQRGTAKTILLDPTAHTEQEATANLNEGDRALVMHIYGGIGGSKGEKTAPFGVVTGHFAYGIAQVIRDSLTNELRWEIYYWQVYAHNPDGIISGTATWANYMGDLQRGWLGCRPISDVMIRLDCVTEDYDFDGIRLSPLDTLQAQLEEMMARYRHGDGDGASLVTPITSCVQDSNQALYVAIQRIEQQVINNPRILDWLRSHPDHPQTLRLNRLQTLGKSLEKFLIPWGIVRPDWERNARKLAGITPPPNLFRAAYKTAIGWRTMIPRFAYDELARIFLQNGAKLWFIRTNQVGGFDPDILPKAPTRLFG